jgi:hypothetical protein
MTFDPHPLLASSTIGTAPSPATSGTALDVQAGEGVLFVAGANATIWPDGTVATLLNAEVVRVTAVSTDTLTIERAQEGSTARSVAAGWRIAQGATPKTFTDIETGGTLAALSDVALTSPAVGDHFEYDGSAWTNVQEADVLIKSVTWSPTDLTADQTDLAVLFLPAPSMIIGSYWRRDVPTDAGSTPTLQIFDADSVFANSGPLALASDTTSFFGPVLPLRTFLDVYFAVGYANVSMSLYMPLSFTFSYVAGVTPGTTMPKFTFAFLIQPF